MQGQDQTEKSTTNKEYLIDKLETRVTKLEMGSQKRMDGLREKLDREHAFFVSKIDTKLDHDAAMTDKEHEKFITEITEAATRAHLSKVLNNKVKRIVKGIVKDIIEDILEDVVEDVVEDLVYRKLKERDAAMKKSMLEAKADQDEIEDELATTRRMLEEHRRQLAVIMDWIRGV